MLLAALMAPFLLLLSAQEVPAPEEFREVGQYIVEQIEKGAAPSLAVAVIREGRVVWAGGFGVADLESKRRATANSIYRLASVSKPITATGLMVLKDRGLLELDAPANRYLAQAKLRAYVGSADQITLRRLANHTSGFYEHVNFFYEGFAPPLRDESIRRYGFAAWEPGKEWIYSNFAFGLLDYVTERVAKMPWSEFMEKNVYDPLKMVGTSDRIRPGQGTDEAPPYRRDDQGRFVRVPPYTFDHPGASAIRSSAKDLARFMLMHLGDGELEGVRILSAESAREMRRQTSRRADGAGNGVGWMFENPFGSTAFTHGGDMPGVTSRVVGYPEDRAAIIALANGQGSPLPMQVCRRLESILFPKGKAALVAVRQETAPAQGSFVGSWKGKVVHFAGDLPITLRVEEPALVKMELAGRSGVMQKVYLGRGRLNGEFEAPIETESGFKGTPRLRFLLRLEGDRAIGVCGAYAPSHFLLPHWVELERN